MIEVIHLSKHYGAKRAVDDISFTVDQGQILGFLGPNGAGKSTTMNIITGYISSTSGTVKIDGVDILEEPIKAKKKIGYLPEQPPLYMDMTVQGYLRFMYELKKVTLPRDKHIDEICQTVKISDVQHRLIKNLSKGYKQRVGLAQALLGNPPVLILDEPTVGLDPQQIIEIRNLIQDLGQKHTVILSSHILPEVQAVCDRVIVISKGKLVADDTPEHLTQSLSHHNLVARVEGEQQQVLQTIRTVPGVKNVEVIKTLEGETADYQIEPQENADIRRELNFALAAKRLALLSLKNEELSLEDVFLELIQNDEAEQTKDADAEQAQGDAGETESPDGQEQPASLNEGETGSAAQEEALPQDENEHLPAGDTPHEEDGPEANPDETDAKKEED